MTRCRSVLVAAWLGLLALVTAFAEEPQRVSVPVMGEFQDSALGGWIRYDGEVTFVWTPTVEGGATIWNLTSWLVAQAWCRNTGAGYTLMGTCSGCIPGVTTGRIVLTEPILAIGRGSQPVHASRVTVALQMGAVGLPPAVAALSIATR